MAAIRRRRSVALAHLAADYGLMVRGILHVGANVGSEAAEYAQLGRPAVTWVEGFPAYYSELCRAIKPYPEQIAHCVLVAESDGEEVQFSTASNTGSSTMMQPVDGFESRFPGITFARPERFAAERLDTFLGRAGEPCDRFNVIVVDVEGAELKVLRSLGVYLASAEAVLVEVSIVPNYVGGPLLGDIDDFLYGSGFRRVRTRVGISSGDAFYLRNERMGYSRLAARAHARLLALGFHLRAWHAARFITRVAEGGGRDA